MRNFDVNRTALLCMDCQAGIVSVYAKPAHEFVARAAGVLKTARAAGMPVIFVQVGFRPGFPEIGGRNQLFAAIKASPDHQKLFTGPGSAIHPALGPEPGDIVVTKHRVSAFAGTDLEMILRAHEIETVILFGIATSGVVLSTFLEASDADFRAVVISDLCVDMHAGLHEELLKTLFPRRGQVVISEEVLSGLKYVE